MHPGLAWLRGLSFTPPLRSPAHRKRRLSGHTCSSLFSKNHLERAGEKTTCWFWWGSHQRVRLFQRGFCLLPLAAPQSHSHQPKTLRALGLLGAKGSVLHQWRVSQSTHGPPWLWLCVMEESQVWCRGHCSDNLQGPGQGQAAGLYHAGCPGHRIHSQDQLLLQSPPGQSCAFKVVLPCGNE